MGHKISITCNYGTKNFQLHVIECLKISITVVYKRHSENFLWKSIQKIVAIQLHVTENFWHHNYMFLKFCGHSITCNLFFEKCVIFQFLKVIGN